MFGVIEEHGEIQKPRTWNTLEELLQSKNTENFLDAFKKTRKYQDVKNTRTKLNKKDSRKRIKNN